MKLQWKCNASVDESPNWKESESKEQRVDSEDTGEPLLTSGEAYRDLGNRGDGFDCSTSVSSWSLYNFKGSRSRKVLCQKGLVFLKRCLFNSVSSGEKSQGVELSEKIESLQEELTSLNEQLSSQTDSSKIERLETLIDDIHAKIEIVKVKSSWLSLFSPPTRQLKPGNPQKRDT